jgi:hypothetical protein
LRQFVTQAGFSSMREAIDAMAFQKAGLGKLREGVPAT